MTSSPSISIVMGVYNAAEQLSETIVSVLAQGKGDFEFIIVNDGSTDSRVGEILADYVKRDSRIRLISKANEGLTRALIDGCSVAKGKYIARIDVGDVMLPERLSRQKAVLDKHSDVVLATCWTECCGPEWEHLYTVRNALLGKGDADEWVAAFPENGDDRNKLLGPTHHGAVMFRADAYRAAGGYRPAFYYGQDWALWYRLADRGKFAGVQEVLYRCRIFPEGISMQNAERQRQIHTCSRGAFLARRKGEDEAPFLGRAAAIRPHADGACQSFQTPAPNLAAGYYFVGEALRRNGDRRCRQYFRRALRLMPYSLKLWVRLVQSLNLTLKWRN